MDYTLLHIPLASVQTQMFFFSFFAFFKNTLWLPFFVVETNKSRLNDNTKNANNTKFFHELSCIFFWAFGFFVVVVISWYYIFDFNEWRQYEYTCTYVCTWLIEINPFSILKFIFKHFKCAYYIWFAAKKGVPIIAQMCHNESKENHNHFKKFPTIMYDSDVEKILCRVDGRKISNKQNHFYL